jgi:NADH-quinone oxidoreductase subunit B|tara:strand:- start:5576 stop:6217 length:642 start_codon:yes stop_codon:yes gene_type:complete
MKKEDVRGDAERRRSVGAMTTDSDLIMEDPPAGDWLTLRSDQLLEWIDDAVYNVSEATGIREVMNKITRPIFNWGMRFSPHPLHFGIMCCALEMGAASGPDFDAERVGVIYRSSPRQCDILIVNGPVCEKLRPKLKTLYEQMPEPKWVIAMGECAISGGPYWDSYSVVAGTDTFIPVDVYIPGCPVRPEALIHGLLTLQKKIRDHEPGMFLRR